MFDFPKNIWDLLAVDNFALIYLTAFVYYPRVPYENPLNAIYIETWWRPISIRVLICT